MGLGSLGTSSGLPGEKTEHLIGCPYWVAKKSRARTLWCGEGAALLMTSHCLLLSLPTDFRKQMLRVLFSSSHVTDNETNLSMLIALSERDQWMSFRVHHEWGVGTGIRVLCTPWCNLILRSFTLIVFGFLNWGMESPDGIWGYASEESNPLLPVLQMQVPCPPLLSVVWSRLTHVNKQPLSLVPVPFFALKLYQLTISENDSFPMFWWGLMLLAWVPLMEE